jgi:integrase
MIKYVFQQRRRVKGKRIKARVYTGCYRLDGELKPTRVALKVTDKQVAEKKLDDIVRQKEREKAGILPPKQLREGAQKQLAVHSRDFIRNLEALGRAKKYVENLQSRLEKLFCECGWKFLSDVTSDSFEHWRANQTTKAAKTLNEYLDAANAYFNWMRQAGRASKNALEDVRKVRTRGKQVRARRALTNSEVGRLLHVAGESKIGYLLAVHTGLRRSELSSLKWSDLELDSGQPSVALSATITKNKKAAILPLHPQLVAELRNVKPLDAKPSDKVLIGRMLPGMWKMKSDLAKAGIKYVEEGRRADFHALRHTLATNLARMNVPPRLAMEMMRHGDMRLTMTTYTDANLLPLAGAIQALPWLGASAATIGQSSTQIRTHSADAVCRNMSHSDANDVSSENAEDHENDSLWHEVMQRVVSRQKLKLAPAVGFEPTTNRLTADRSTTELRWIIYHDD